MYQQDQNRAEPNQGMHFHVHQCVCTSPLYNPYRQPIIAPYVPPPVARPYNLAHYQYTSYNIPYNVPVYPNAIVHQSASSSGNTAGATTSESRSEPRDNGDGSALRNNEDLDEFAIGVTTDATSEDFTKFLEHGCVIAEKIAIRNQHRPCFKNIQNLCNRTKNEILKPSHTVSNIHSQGIPWATKDFIYAYVRLINCWHMLKGYLQAKDGTLGNIDRELTADFKNCYSIWESNTKDLAEHMIRIFSNLDNNVSNPTPSQSFANRNRLSRTVPSALLESPVLETPVLIPQVNDEVNQFSESTTEPSPREEESDGESRVYMKPGSYNVPKKNNSPDTSPPSIEFFENVKNISSHYKRLEAKKQANANNDKEWKNAISATSNLIMKNSLFDESGRSPEDEQFSPTTIKNDVDNVKRWLLHDHFSQQNLSYPLSELRILTPDRPVTLLQRNDKKEGIQETVNDISRNITLEINKQLIRKFGPDPPKSYMNKLERDSEAMKLLLEELEKTPFNQTMTGERSMLQDCPETIKNIIHKHNCKMYKNPLAVLGDLKRITSHAQILFNKDSEVLKQISDFCGILDECLERLFPDINLTELSFDLEGLDKQ